MAIRVLKESVEKGINNYTFRALSQRRSINTFLIAYMRIVRLESQYNTNFINFLPKILPSEDEIIDMEKKHDFHLSSSLRGIFTTLISPTPLIGWTCFHIYDWGFGDYWYWSWAHSMFFPIRYCERLEKSIPLSGWACQIKRVHIIG